MVDRPQVIVFDVNETLSDMAPMGERFAEIGAPAHLAKLWFATVLRDGFALATAGSQEKFAVLAREALESVLTGVDLACGMDDAVAHVMAGFGALHVHPEVPDGVRALRRAGLRLVTLTNGASEVADRLLEGADIRKEFEQLLSVEQAGAWKPARAAYEHAAETCGVRLGDMLLIAVHPWDIDGAARAGMATGWINRRGEAYPGYFRRPSLQARSLVELAERVVLG